MTSPFLRATLPVALAAFAVLSSGAVRAEEPPAPSPAMPEKTPAKIPDAPDTEVGVHFEAGTPKYEDVLAKAKSSNKPIFIDFFTDWCGWCKKLDADTYTQPAVGKVMEGFVNIQVNAEKGEGVDLAKRFGARGFPTLVIVGTDDQEIDRIVGYLPPDRFETEIRRILSGEGTLQALRKAADANPDDLSAAFSLIKKLLTSNASDAASRLDALEEKAKGKDRGVEAGILFLKAQRSLSSGKRDDALASFDRVALEFADTESAKGATSMSLRLRAGPKADADEALAFAAALRAKTKSTGFDGATEQAIANLHLRAAEKAMERAAADAGEDAQKLNAIAWTCYERRIALVAATGWARTAVEKSDRDVQILDTLACLLSLQKKHDEALKIEFEALGKLKDGDDAMRRDFQRNIARWITERDEANADKAVPVAKPAPKAKAK